MVLVAHCVLGVMPGLLIFFVRSLVHVHPGHVVVHVHAGHATVHSRHILILPRMVAGFLLLSLLRRLPSRQSRYSAHKRERHYCDKSDWNELSWVHGPVLLLPILRTST